MRKLTTLLIALSLSFIMAGCEIDETIKIVKASFDDSAAGRYNLELKKKSDVVEISWSSDDSSVITDNGIVTRPIDENKTATLTATRKYNDKSSSKDFKVTVYKIISEVNSVSLIISGTGSIDLIPVSLDRIMKLSDDNLDLTLTAKNDSDILLSYFIYHERETFHVRETEVKESEVLIPGRYTKHEYEKANVKLAPYLETLSHPINLNGANTLSELAKNLQSIGLNANMDSKTNTLYSSILLNLDALKVLVSVSDIDINELFCNLIDFDLLTNFDFFYLFWLMWICLLQKSVFRLTPLTIISAMCLISMRIRQIMNRLFLMIYPISYCHKKPHLSFSYIKS